MATRKTSRCNVARGEVDLDAYATRDEVWREIDLATPARRALVDAGLLELDQLSKWSRAELASLHGMGPNALNKIHRALDKHGISFRH